MFKLAIVVAPPEAVFKAVARTPLEEAVKVIAENGFNGVEVSLIDPKSYTPSRLSKIISDYGLEIPAFSTGLNYLHLGYSLISLDPYLREAAVNRLREFIDLAQFFGAGVVIGLMRGRIAKGQSREDAYKLLVDNLRRVCKYAEANEVPIFFEPLNRYETNIINTVDEGLKLVEDVGSPALKLLLDTFHMNIEEASIERSIKKAAGKIGHFHLADSNRLAPGMGHIDFRSVLEALRETGYSGYLSVEVVIKPSLEKVLKTTVSTLKPVLITNIPV